MSIKRKTSFVPYLKSNSNLDAKIENILTLQNI